MQTAGSSEGSRMDPVLAIGSSLPPVQARVSASRGTGPTAYAPLFSTAAPDLAQTLDALNRGDPASDQQVMTHFISHIDAECFISLLKILDRVPDDYQARAEYKRFYQQLRQTLEVPLLPVDPQPAGTPTDPLR